MSNGNNGRTKHWYASAKLRDDYEHYLRLNGFCREHPFRGQTIVVVTRVLGPRQRLWDASSGFRGSWKELEDALVAVGWWEDDGPEHIAEITFRQDATRRDLGPAVLVQVFQFSAEREAESERRLRAAILGDLEE